MKEVKLTIWFITATIAITVGFIAIYSYTFDSEFLPNEDQIELNCKQELATTLTKLPKNIIAPTNSIEKQILFVLNKYPEIANMGNRVYFVKGNIATTMATQPKVNMNVFDRKTRDYVIIINNNKNQSTFNFYELDEVYQVAWIAHEFGHIIDYKNRSSLSLIGMGVNYLLNPSFKKAVELFATKSAVYHGFGAETHRSTSFSFNSLSISDSYKKQMEESYLDPNGINKLIEEYESLCNE